MPTQAHDSVCKCKWSSLGSKHMQHLDCRLNERPGSMRDGVTEQEKEEGEGGGGGGSDDRLGRMIRKRKVELSKRRETKAEESKDVGSRQRKAKLMQVT